MIRMAETKPPELPLSVSDEPDSRAFPDRKGCCSRHLLDCEGPEACIECHGTGRCNCLACVHLNKANCLRCRPSASIVKWRNFATREERLGPAPGPGSDVHTPTQRYISYLPYVAED
jgi:hypothetical protein